MSKKKELSLEDAIEGTAPSLDNTCDISAEDTADVNLSGDSADLDAMLTDEDELVSEAVREADKADSYAEAPTVTAASNSEKADDCASDFDGSITFDDLAIASDEPAESLDPDADAKLVDADLDSLSDDEVLIEWKKLDRWQLDTTLMDTMLDCLIHNDALTNVELQAALPALRSTMTYNYITLQRALNKYSDSFTTANAIAYIKKASWLLSNFYADAMHLLAHKCLTVEQLHEFAEDRNIKYDDAFVSLLLGRLYRDLLPFD